MMSASYNELEQLERAIKASMFTPKLPNLGYCTNPIMQEQDRAYQECVKKDNRKRVLALISEAEDEQEKYIAKMHFAKVDKEEVLAERKDGPFCFKFQVPNASSEPVCTFFNESHTVKDVYFFVWHNILCQSTVDFKLKIPYFDDAEKVFWIGAVDEIGKKLGDTKVPRRTRIIVECDT